MQTNEEKGRILQEVIADTLKFYIEIDTLTNEQVVARVAPLKEKLNAIDLTGVDEDGKAKLAEGIRCLDNILVIVAECDAEMRELNQ